MMKYLLFTICFSVFCVESSAQKLERGASITGSGATVESYDTMVRVSFDLDVPQGSVRRNFRYTISPAFAVYDSIRLPLTPISPVGLRKSRSEHRKAVLGGRARSRNRFISTKSSVGDDTRYSIAVPYESWMSGQTLSLKLDKSMRSYHEPIYLGRDLRLSGIDIPSPWHALVGALTFDCRDTMPRWTKESIVYDELSRQNLMLEQRGAMMIDFALGTTRMREGFMNNAEGLNELQNRLLTLKPYQTIEHLRILGQGVSDGDRLLETGLSTERANALKRHLSRFVDADKIEVVSSEAIWSSLRHEIAHSALDGGLKTSVLQMIDTTANRSMLEHNLMVLDNGSAYWYIKDHLLPGLRDAAYVSVCYSNSLHPVDQYVEKAVELMNDGRYDRAISLLDSSPDDTDPRIVNMLGVARLLTNSDAVSFLNRGLSITPSGARYDVLVDVKPTITVPPSVRAIPYATPYSEYSDANDKQDGSLAVYYQVGNSRIFKDFENNAESLSSIVSAVKEISSNGVTMVKKIRIVGQASPEGAQALNERLSTERANSLRSYICSNTGLSSDVFDIVSIGPAWDKFRELIAASGMEHKDKVLRIIDTTHPGAHRDSLIHTLDYGHPEQYIKSYIYPELRNATYIKVYYDIQQDTNSEAVHNVTAIVDKGDYKSVLPTPALADYNLNAALLTGVTLTMTGDLAQGAAYLSRAVELRRQITEE